MRSEVKIAKCVVITITGVCGTFLNSIIVGLNFKFLRDITKGYNRILFSIGLINIIFQGVLIFDTIGQNIESLLSNKNLVIAMFSLQLILIGINVWNTTWLSFFCAIRLVNYSHWFFLKIKAKCFTFLPHLLVSSVFFSVAINIPVFWTTTLDDPENGTDYPTTSGRRIIVDPYYIIFGSLFNVIIPFSMTCVSIGLSVITLVRHIRRMGSNDSRTTSDKLQGHYRAVRTMLIHVISDTVFFLTAVLGPSVPVILNSPAYSVLWMIVLMYPTSQAFIIIFGNPKLKTAAYGLIQVFR